MARAESCGAFRMRSGGDGICILDGRSQELVEPGGVGDQDGCGHSHER